MRRSYSMLGLMGMVTLLCTNALIGCYGGSAGRGRCGFPCPEERGVKEKRVIPITSTSPIISTIIVEEFIYPPTDDQGTRTVGSIDGLNGGIGWAGPWSDPGGSFNITAPGLTHPVQTSDTNVSGNNKATGVTDDIPGSGASRNMNAASIASINAALNSSGGVWFRWLLSFPPQSTGLFTVTLTLGSFSLTINVDPGANTAHLAAGAERKSTSLSLAPGSTPMVITNIVKADPLSGNFIVNGWILQQAASTFSLSSTPDISFPLLLPFGPLPVNITSASMAIADTNSDSIDEIYGSNNPLGLAIKVSP